MFVPSPFLINSFSSFCLLLLKSSATDLQVFLAVQQEEPAFSEAKTKFSHSCGLNYSLLSFEIY